MDGVVRDCVAPVHVGPRGPVRVVLVEDMVLAVEVDGALDVVEEESVRWGR